MSSALPESPVHEAPSQRAVNSTLPPLSPADRNLFRLLVSHRGDLPTLAKSAGRDLIDLIEWAAAPAIQAWLAAYHEIHEQCSRLQAYFLLSTATDALVKTINTTADPVELRRAACFLVHASAAVPTFKPLSSPSSPSGASSPKGGAGRVLAAGGGSASTRSTQPRSATIPDRADRAPARPADVRAGNGSASPSSSPLPPTAAPARMAPSEPAHNPQRNGRTTAPAPPSRPDQPFPSDVRSTLYAVSSPSLLAAAAGAPGPAP